MVHFPSPHAGLAAYRKLREFRRLHETTYNLEDITEKEGKFAGQLYPTKMRGRVLMNQKANSVADLAAVLWQQEIGPSEDRVANAERRMKRTERLKRQKGESKVKKNPLDVEKELQGVEGVYVRWADVLDAEYAETWPEGVVHDRLQKSRHTAAWPVLEAQAQAEVGVEAPATDQGKDSGTQKEVETPKQGWGDYISSWIPGRSRTPAVAPA